MSDPELQLQQRLGEIRNALECLRKDENMEKLNELCGFMDNHELPPAARLFIFNHGILSVEDMAEKHHELKEKMESAVNLGFSYKCMKDFIRLCMSESTYDYPNIDIAADAPTTPSVQPSIESAPAVVCCSRTLPCHCQHSLPETNCRNSQDTGYYSKENMPQQPFAKPRSFSVQLKKDERLPPTPPSKSHPASPTKSSKSKGILGLFLFPENAKKSSKREAHGQRHHNTQT